jgi:competence protein ComGC
MKKQAFTLVEFLIYLGILSLVLVLTAGFLWDFIFGNIKATSYREVQENGRFALLKITQEIKKATEINSPPPSSSSSTLSLARIDSHLNPTVFDVINGRLRIRRGLTGTSYYLTSDQVIVSSLQFTNLSYPETPGIIRVEIVLEHINPGNRTEYQTSVNLESSVSLLEGGAAATPPHLIQLHYRWRNDDGGE